MYSVHLHIEQFEFPPVEQFRFEREQEFYYQYGMIKIMI